MSGPRNLLATRPVHKLRLDIAGTNITTGAWVEIEDSMPKACDAIEVFYTGESILRLAQGASGSEVEMDMYLVPGGSPILIPVNIARSKRLAVRALDQNSTFGELVINFYG